MKKQFFTLLIFGFLGGVGVNLQEAAAQSKGYDKGMADVAEDLGLTTKDINKFLETKAGASESKNPLNPGPKYNFANLGSWATAGASLLGLGLFFYLIRKKF